VGCLDGTGKVSAQCRTTASLTFHSPHHELISRAEAIVEILAGTDWKLVPLASRIPPDYTQLSELLRPVTLREPTTLFTGTLQVTLTKRRPLLYGNVVHNSINEDVLLDGAFETREIDFVIQSGEFPLSWNYRAPGVRPIYGLRLTCCD
jgi:hypothetical protein